MTLVKLSLLNAVVHSVPTKKSAISRVRRKKMNGPLCVTSTSVFTHSFFFLVSYITWGLIELKNSPFTYNCFHLLWVFQGHLGFHPGIWSSMWLHLLLYPDLHIFFKMWLHFLLHSGKLCSWQNFQEFL